MIKLKDSKITCSSKPQNVMAANAVLEYFAGGCCVGDLRYSICRLVQSENAVPDGGAAAGRNGQL